MKKTLSVMMFITLCLVTLLGNMNAAHAHPKATKLSYSTPELVGMDATKLSEVDQAVEKAISDGITPGATLLIAKDGKIVKERAYGHAFKYDMGTLLDKPNPMKKDTMFDLASVTKVMGTTQGIMKLVSEGKLSVDDKVTEYIPAFGANGKEHVTVADLLTHTSGLTPWYPTYLFVQTPDGVLDYINQLPLEYETGTDRRYSDFSFMTLGFIIEKVTSKKLDVYLESEIYQPLKMKHTMFTPDKIDKKKIAATEWGNLYEYRMIDDPNFGYYVEEDPDMFDGWRDYTLVGEVNDGNSFYGNGGVAGHAGLFSTAKDLAKLGQLMLNGGSYGKTKLYDEEIIEEFTSDQAFGQGYGWERQKNWYMGDLYSDKAFGHTGFTGTQVIFDPEYDLQIILLTNKQNNGPKPDGKYYSTGPLSKEIANIVYESIKK